MKYVTSQKVQALYYGSLCTACGGGEYSDHLPALLTRHIEAHGPVRIESLEELSGEGRYLTVGIMGSMLEASLQTGAEGVELVKRFSDESSIPCRGLFSIEASSLNVLFPILVAGMLGVPLVDGDCMGRAFPEFQMTTAQAEGRQIAPMSLLTPGGEYYHFEDLENLLFEVKAREIASHAAGIAYFSGFPLDRAALRSVLLPGTLSFVYEIGLCFIGPDSYSDLLERIIETTKNSTYGSAIELFVGTTAEIGISLEGGRRWSQIGLKGTGSYQHSTFSLLAQNELLIAFRDDRISAMVPDLITLIDLHSLKPLSLSALKTDMRVAVIGIPAPVRLKSPAMLQVLGPLCFGYSTEYIPIEKIHSAWYY